MCVSSCVCIFGVCRLLTVIVVVWVLLITGVNGWITARALCGCRVAGSSRERQRAGKLFLPSGDWRREKGEQRGERGNSGRQKSPIGGESLRVWGPYGRQHFALRFIAHLAVLINGKPVHRALSSRACFSLSHCYFHFCCSTTPRHSLPNLSWAVQHFQASPVAGKVDVLRWKHLHHVWGKSSYFVMMIWYACGSCLRSSNFPAKQG